MPRRIPRLDRRWSAGASPVPRKRTRPSLRGAIAPGLPRQGYSACTKRILRRTGRRSAPKEAENKRKWFAAAPANREKRERRTLGNRHSRGGGDSQKLRALTSAAPPRDLPSTWVQALNEFDSFREPDVTHSFSRAHSNVGEEITSRAPTIPLNSRDL